MIRYVFKEEPLAIKNAKRANPQKIGEALAKVAGNSGRLTSKAVVEAAKDPRNALHKHFEWDDTKAANSYRLDQARFLIRAVRVEDDDAAEEPLRAFYSVSDKGGKAYHTLDAVRASRELQLAVLKQAERDLTAFERRYSELNDICDLVRTARDRLSDRISKQETHATA